jgi:hypothetical protein
LVYYIAFVTAIGTAVNNRGIAVIEPCEMNGPQDQKRFRCYMSFLCASFQTSERGSSSRCLSIIYTGMTK